MRDLSLHVLDLVENSIRAGATVVAITVEASRAKDTLTLSIDDNGPGFSVAADVASDPFYTTKTGKRTGLGLSLFRAAVERADGTLEIAASPLGGAMVSAKMRLSHVDRSPLGDLANTVAAIVATNPDLDLRVMLGDGRERVVALAPASGAAWMGSAQDPLAVATRAAELVRNATHDLWDGKV